MSCAVLFYVSGHGYGHARRTAQIIAALVRLAPQVPIHVRTTAPAGIFTRVGVPAANVAPSSLDSGVVEQDPLMIDTEKTVRRVLDLIAQRDRIIVEEVATVRACGAALIVADISPLAGDIAAAVGVPCVASGNFTWDWIYEPYFTGRADGDAVLGMLTAGYRAMDAVFRQPLNHPMPQFRQVIDVPFVVTRSALGRDEVSRRLGLDPADRRPRVLVGMRGGTSQHAVEIAARGAGDLQFLVLQPPSPDTPPNVRHVVQSPQTDFSDLLAASDVVVSKFGYGTVADCIASGTRMLVPRRENFREEILFAAQAPAVLHFRPISREEYESGDWATPLRELLKQPAAPSVRTDGAEVCANEILARLSR